VQLNDHQFDLRIAYSNMDCKAVEIHRPLVDDDTFAQELLLVDYNYSKLHC
jgi:hypothetical protein